MTKASPPIYDVHVFSAVEHANRHRILLLVDKEDSRLPESITIFIFSFFWGGLFDLPGMVCAVNQIV